MAHSLSNMSAHGNSHRNVAIWQRIFIYMEKHLSLQNPLYFWLISVMILKCYALIKLCLYLIKTIFGGQQDLIGQE